MRLLRRLFHAIFHGYYYKIRFYMQRISIVRIDTTNNWGDHYEPNEWLSEREFLNQEEAIEFLRNVYLKFDKSNPISGAIVDYLLYINYLDNLGQEK